MRKLKNLKTFEQMNETQTFSLINVSKEYNDKVDGSEFLNKENTMKYKLQKVVLIETTLKKMLTTHSDAGYIIISAFRGEYDLRDNYKRTKQLQGDIKSSGYSYFPVWGGFVETDKDGKKHEVKEKSIVVTNFPRGSSEPKEDSEELKKLGQKLAKKYDQESFLYKPKGTDSKAHFITQTGKVDFSFNAASPAVASDVYFTNLKKSRFKEKGEKSFAYREGVVYMAKKPKSLHEAYKRYGENFFNFD